jgi:hypothetical protein
MPLPFILLGLATGSALYGIKKGIDAHSDNSRARELNEEAHEVYERAERKLSRARKKTTETLAELGKLKLETWDQDLSRFVALFEQIREVEFTGQVAQEMAPGTISRAELAEMKDLSLKASEVVAGGAAALSTGALVGVASYGGAMMFATASTGTAISALSGAAAANATLAWFGGGSLAAGGLGMAGGAAVLGGLVAGPVLAVGGAVLAAKARENLANARSNYAKAKEAAEEMNNATSIVKGIGEVAEQFHEVVDALGRRLRSSLASLERVLRTAGNDYRTYSDEQKRIVYQAVQLAKATKAALETPLLTKSGALSRGCSAALREARAALAEA